MKHPVHGIVHCFALILGCLAAPGALRAQDDLPALEERAVKLAVEQVEGCVVRIETLGGAEQVEGQLLAAGPTTGLIVSPDGLIVSSFAKAASMLIGKIFFAGFPRACSASISPTSDPAPYMARAPG